MICGVQGDSSSCDSCIVILKDDLQGDFTRGLVNNPPKMIWTRELKVSGLIVTCVHAGRTVTPFQVRRCIEHFHTLQTRGPDMHGYRNRGRLINLHPVP
jgi:hypothetical protein